MVAVDRVTLRIGQGEMVALLGPSGCGKTTTLRMIAGLIEPSDGSIYIDGKPVTRVPAHKREIGMLFQNYALFPHLSVGGNVAFGLEMRGVKKAEAARRVREALQLVQLEHLSERLPAALSGGQQQRVALARALVIEPSVLLLDEPLGALDKGLRETMEVELGSLQRRLGITTVIVTHDQEEALTLADRIVVMRAGRLEQVGTPHEIYARPISRFVASFLGAANFLRGEVTGQEDGRAVVSVAAGGRITVPIDGVCPAGAVLIAVRPEAVSVEPLRSGGSLDANATEATIEQVIYRGSTTQLHMRLATGETFLAFHQNKTSGRPTERLEPGSRVTARWGREDSRMVTDG